MNKIVVDIYGADAGPAPLIRGVATALKDGMPFFPVMVGDSALVTAIFDAAGIPRDAYETVHTTDFIAADEPPTVVFGGRENSSLVLSYTRLKTDNDCVALLSAGNTGALLVGSIRHLGLTAGVKFPALASALPCAGDNLLCLVDCGANVRCTPDDLALFARMGDIFCRCFCGIERPRVGLMSVGREQGKGNELTVAAYDKIAALDLNFVGNLEGSDMVSGYADVVVTDGFSGNILLKSTEAAGKAALAAVESLDLDEDTMARIRSAVLKKFEFNARGAATFLGAKKTVVKMHGCATEETVIASLDQILRLTAADFSAHIAAEMAKG